MTVCKINPKILAAIAEVKDCQRFNPSETSGYGSACVPVMERAMRRVTTRFLGRGNFRHAWQFRSDGENCVVKLANNEVKRKHNIIEADTWRKAPNDVRRWLLPVTQSDPEGLWLVMPYALNDEVTVAKRDDIGAQIEWKFRSMGLELPDQHTGNVGVYKGKPVSIDYGFGVEGAYDTHPSLRPGMGLTTPGRRGRGVRKMLRKFEGKTANLQARQEREFGEEVSKRRPVFTQWVVPEIIPEGKKAPTRRELERRGFAFGDEGELIDPATGEVVGDVNPTTGEVIMDEDLWEDEDLYGPGGVWDKEGDWRWRKTLDEEMKDKERKIAAASGLFDFGPRDEKRKRRRFWGPFGRRGGRK